MLVGFYPKRKLAWIFLVLLTIFLVTFFPFLRQNNNQNIVQATDFEKFKIYPGKYSVSNSSSKDWKNVDFGLSQELDDFSEENSFNQNNSAYLLKGVELPLLENSSANDESLAPFFNDKNFKDRINEDKSKDSSGSKNTKGDEVINDIDQIQEDESGIEIYNENKSQNEVEIYSPNETDAQTGNDDTTKNTNKTDEVSALDVFVASVKNIIRYVGFFDFVESGKVKADDDVVSENNSGIEAQEKTANIENTENQESIEGDIIPNGGVSEEIFTESSIVFDDFSILDDYENKKMINLQLRSSLFAESNKVGDVLSFEYRTSQGESWTELQDYTLDQKISNAINGGYFLMGLPVFGDWETISELEVRVSYKSSEIEFNNQKTSIFLDSLWLEADAEIDAGEIVDEDDVELRELKKKYRLDLTSNKIDFKSGENPKLKFKFKKNRGMLGEIGATILSLVRDEYENINIVLRLKKGGIEIDNSKINYRYINNGEFEVFLNSDEREFSPGKYEVELEVMDNNLTLGRVLDFSQDFNWGVLAFNPNKSIYNLNEKAFLQMAVLSDEGHTICNADLSLEITLPNGTVVKQNTGDPNDLFLPADIVRNSDCGFNNVIETPDYYSYLELTQVGEYFVRLIAKTKNGQKEISDKFEVREFSAFEIERIGPTRIFPWANYQMSFNIKANKDFQGEFVEYLPKSFELVYASGTEEVINGNSLELHWKVDWKAGEIYQLRYIFDAPNISPEFFLLGPATFVNEEFTIDNPKFKEIRSWQIASDAAIQNLLSEQITRVTDAAGGGYTQVAQLAAASFTAGDTYFIYLHSGMAGSANNVNTNYQITFGSNVQFTGRIESDNGNGSAGEAGHISWFDVYTMPGTTENVTFSIDSVTGSSYAFNAQLMAINLSDLTTQDWEFAEDDDSGAPTAHPDSSAWQQFANLTLSKADGAKDWLVFAMEEVVVDDTGSAYQGHIYDGANPYMQVTIEGENAAEQLSYVLLRPFDNVAKNTVFSLRAADNAALANNNDHYRSRVFALNLDAFESHKTYYADINTAISTYTTWSELGNLNSGGNYQPTTTGNQFIFGSFINDITNIGNNSDFRLLVNSALTPTNYGWQQSGTPNFTGRVGYDNTDEIFNNVFSRISIPSTGYGISLEATEVSAGSHVGDEIALAVFSAEIVGNVPPTATFNSVAQKSDGTGVVDISIEANDANSDNLKVRVNYATSSCNFTSPLDPTLNEATSTIVEDYGDVWIENDDTYQVGTTSHMVITTSGSNTVNFDWNTISDIPSAEGVYCLRIIANDGQVDQTTSATTTVVVDNVAPQVPGNLVVASTTFDSVTLNVGSQSSDPYFSEYKVFYKKATSSVSTSDAEYDNANFSEIDFNGMASFVISGLDPDSDYVFNIWAYDLSGNYSSAIEVTTQTDIPPRVKTVQYLAGVYSGNGTTGRNTNTQYTFSAFDFSLVEENVQIKDAYIIFEAQYDAYSNSIGNYTGYSLALDACDKPCTPIAFTGTSSVTQTDNTILSYDETESNYVRLLFDVMNESDLADYAGGGEVYSLQTGYRINFGSTINSISWAAAKLVVTYYYDVDSESITNTVIYPLDSTATNDTGTMRSSQTDDCVLNSTCPTFDYNYEAPEFSQKLSQWFEIYAINTSNATDITATVNIQGNDTNSPLTFIHESFNGNAQNNMPVVYFEGVPGFEENTDQVLEVDPYCSGGAATYYLLGGEVFETYAASSTAAVKTRTVSFPLGVVNNGRTSAQTLRSTNVAFPENGNSNGVVTIKSAWFRITSNNYLAGPYTITVNTKVGNNATSSNAVYNYDSGGDVVRPSFNFIHIIPSSDYSQLAQANASTSKTITLATQNSDAAAQGGLSAELMITYTYSNETSGYLSSVNVYGGQTMVNGNAQNATSSTSNLFFPEDDVYNTVLSAGMLSSHLSSNSGAAMPAAFILFDVGIATSSPTCTNAFGLRPDARNAFMEYYENVTASISNVNNQSYVACYSNDGAGGATTGAKMNSQIIYTYQYYNPPAVIAIANEQYLNDSATTIANGSWIDETTVKLNASASDLVGGSVMNFYFELIGNSSNFSSDTTEPASFCSSGTEYSSCANKIWKATSTIVSGSATATSTIASIPDSSSGYKWQVLACNNLGNCSPWATYDTNPNFKIDSIAPTSPGNLSLATSTPTTLILNFGSESVDSNFSYYRIFYKKGILGVTESDIMHSDSNLNYIDYNGAATTTISGLESGTQYVINIWAYDEVGNKNNAAEVVIETSVAAHARARTVIFPAGTYSSSDGITGQNSNTNYQFSSFNFSLAETEVSIKSAYLIYEAQFEAYADNTGSYTGYTLAFDACQESCAADAFTGSGVSSVTDTNVLAYGENMSNQVRLIMDVTNEVQLASYGGNGTQMEGRVGYNIRRSSAVNSIANARALLVVTYTYNHDDSTNFTNTVAYPLSSNTAGDYGTRQAGQTSACTKNTNCPTFAYNMQIPELSSTLFDWFEIFFVNDGNVATDVSFNVNIQTVDVDSVTFIHESAMGGSQGHLPRVIIPGLFGLTENSNQNLEIYSVNGGGSNYLMGGEVFETYTAAISANTKTRTVSFPIGVISNGQSTSLWSSSTDVYFPENGNGSGIVSVKSAWFRIIGDSSTGADTVTVSTKVGNNAQSGNAIYNLNSATTVVKPAYKIIHVIPSADYAELALANGSAAKTTVLNVTNGSTALGGVSAELMITYTYTNEESGYLSSLSVFGGQSLSNADAQSDTATSAALVFSELSGSKTIRRAGLLTSYLGTDNDGFMPANWQSLGSNLAISSPSCSNTYYASTDSGNSFMEYYQNVTASLTTTNNQAYGICYSSTNAGDTSVGAKMNTIIYYTYQWDAPPLEFTQNSWRWYENIDAVQPTVAKASEKAMISNVNIGDVLRLRMNVAVSNVDLPASSQNFKLQYGKGSNCAIVSWTDVGGLAATTEWRGYNNPTPVDGTTISSRLLASSTVNGSYEETNSSISNPNAISIGGYGEWDWTLYNYSASSSDYCFRMIKGNDDVLDSYLENGYPKLTSAPANTKPNDPGSLVQTLNNGTTSISNNSWINESSVKLKAAVSDPNISEILSLYFELKPATSTLTIATTVPAGACFSGTTYNACASKIWIATSTLGDYRTTYFVATSSITAIPDNSTGYQWQVLACDDDNYCSEWKQPDVGPNFKIDTVDPTAPGNLIYYSSTATSITLTFGTPSSENNFQRYRLYYKPLYSGVTETDDEWSDSNLNYIDYNLATSTTINNLAAGTLYYFNIWVYDRAGNNSVAAVEASGTTASSYTPPTGNIFTAAQKSDGSGAVDISIQVDDPDNDNTVRAKIMYQGGTNCSFTGSEDVTIDSTDANVSATYGDPMVDNNATYQVGTSSGWILTSPGENFVLFDWLSKNEIPTANGTYCLGLVVNDGLFDSATDTALIIIDNVAPSAPGALGVAQKNYNSARLSFGGASADPRFDHYEIYYKQGTAGVTINDIEHSDGNLNYANYNNATSTVLSGLDADTNYVVNIWAYDTRGNVASSTEITFKTNAVPTNIIATDQFLSDGTTSIINGSWITENTVVLKSSVHDQDIADNLTFYFELIAATGTFSSYGSVPGSICSSGTAFGACSSKIWAVSTSTYELPNDWYDADWLYRKRIVINSNQVLANENNFTILATTTDSDLATKARSDGYDILFTDSSGTTTLKYERENYDSATGQLAAWVQTNLSSTTDTVIYMYYGNSQADIDNATTTGAWESSYGGVWHLDDTVVDESSQASAHLDSVGNKNGNQYGNNEVSYYIYRGQEFDGNDYIDLGNTNKTINTISFWVKADTNSEEVIDLDGTRTITINSGVVQANGFSGPTIFVDGVATTSINTSWHMVTIKTSTGINASSMKIGKVGAGYMNGVIDEVTISSVSRADTWIRTKYNNQRGVNGFLSIESEEKASSYYETATVITIPDSSAGYKWQVKACDDDSDCSSWGKFNLSVPNFKVDITNPTAPGALSLNSRTSGSITLRFGASTTESNFSQYKIFYSNTSNVDENDTEQIDDDLNYIDYNGTTISTISGLDANTTYYFNIWAYDQSGRKASSTEVSIATLQAVSTPGVAFYGKGTRVLYYKVWNGTSWGGEQIGPTVGSAVGDNIRHVSALRSDDGSKVAVVIKTWDGTNQEWWATVYRYVANNFVNTSQLGSAQNSTTNNNLITACLGSLSGGEFVAIRNNNASDGTLVYSWNSGSGWTSEGAGPDPIAVLNSCELVRRPETDNYILITYDDDVDIGTAYYTGGSTYANSWTTWTEHSTSEQNADDYPGGAFFDYNNNTRGAISYSNSATNAYTYAKYFDCNDTSITFGPQQASPTTAPSSWGNSFVYGEFSTDIASSGIAYYIGSDINSEVNVYKVNVNNSTVSWSTVSNGDNISSGGLYAYTNYAQKPFDLIFYKGEYATALWNSNTNPSTPYYRVLNASTNTLDASNTAVPGAGTNLWTRVRTYQDPNEEEFVAIYQNDDIDFSAIFWDGANNRFYNSINNPGSGQIWTEIVTGSGAASANYECITYAFTTFNSPPNNPNSLTQYATTTIANQAWISTSTVRLTASVNDSDTSEVITLYIQAIPVSDSFSATTTPPGDACASSTIFSSCVSKIWKVATSTAGDYSVTPFTATATIRSIPDSSTGYKWQTFACDDENACSGWTVFNATTPNFKIDTTAPSAPGALIVASKNSSSITLNFGATTTEANFLQYKIYYKIGSSGVTESSTEHTDSDLSNILFNGTTNTVVINLASSTQYVFNIWAYDLAGNKASSTVETATTTDQGPVIRQSSYILENDDGANVNSNTAEVAADTQLNNLYIGERFNARIQVENVGGDNALSKNYKLQYENQTDASSTWVDVGAATQISFSAGISGATNDFITSSKAAFNGNSWMNGYWYENTGSINNFSLTKNYYTEFVFALQTGNALAGKTYRLRLYNVTNNEPLAGYSSYPTITSTSSSLIKYSKDGVASLGGGIPDLSYYLDPEGYGDVATNDDLLDNINGVAQYSVYNFAKKHTNNSDAITFTWDGQSNVAGATRNVVVQVYKYGSPNQWVTVATNATSTANDDFTMTVNINSSLASYYDGSNWTYWRIYQGSGDQSLKTDYINLGFSTPVADVRQVHYRWRNDDGSEAAATWREAEDLGDPTSPTVSIEKNNNIRLRLEVANVGAGSATNYDYRIEYATTTGNCSTDPGGWTSVPTDGTKHWRMATSSQFVNGAIANARLTNSEGYTFVNGKMIEDPSNSSGNITMTESRYTELEYAIFATNNATIAGTYCFRVTNSGSALNSYNKLAVVTIGGNTNTTPYFTSDPSDNGSASTSPTNYGNDIVFTASAGDDDGDDYYLAICKTNSVTPGIDAPPTCGGGNWCVSQAASSTEEATCSYTTADASESLSWYAFVCDKKVGYGIAKCSSMSQGSGSMINDSPFAINHPPVFTSVSTAVPNQNPGSTFRINTVSSETDTAGGIDTMTIYVCLNNSASFAGCAGGVSDTLCSIVATTTSNPYCSFLDVAPTPPATTNYYAFAYDNHGLAATTNSRTSNYTINNSAPSLGPLVLNSGSPITLFMKGSDTAVSTVNSSVIDLNGCSTLVSATAMVYFSNVAGGYNCVSNDNNCYSIGSANCAVSNCSGADDTEATYTCTTNLKYYAMPTDNSLGNPNSSYNWLSRINVFDGTNYSATTSPGVELNTTMAIEVLESDIDFGNQLFMGDDSGTENATTTLENYGNSPINTEISGTNMVGNPSGTINVGYIEWSLSNFTWSAGTDLALTAMEVNLDAPRPTSATPIRDYMYWGIGIPFGTPANDFEGVNTFTVKIDSSGW